MTAKRIRDESEDKLFWQVKTVARHSAVYGLMNFLSRAASLVLVPLYVRFMEPAEYGVLEILTVSQTLLQSVLLLGFNSALVRYYATADSPRDRTGYFRSALTTVMIGTSAALLVLFAGARGINALVMNNAGPLSTPGLWRLLFLIILFDTLNQMLLALFRAQERPYRYSGLNLVQFFGALLLNIVLVAKFRMGVQGALIGSLSATILATLVGLVLAGRETGVSISRARVSRLASFGLPLIVSAVAFFAINSSDRFFLKAFRGVHDVGIYTLGYKFGLIMSVLVNAFVVAWPPLMYRIAREPDAPRIYARVLTYFTLGAGSVFLLLASFSHEIVWLLRRPEYEPAASFAWIILLSYLVQGIYYVFTVGVTITDKVKWIALVVLAGAVVNVAANIVLIPLFGMHGAAWATLLSFLVLAVLMWAAARHEYPMTWETGRMIRLVLFGGACLAVNAAVLGHDSIGDAGMKLLVTALFPVLLYLTGFFSGEELLRAKEMLKRILKRGSISLP